MTTNAIAEYTAGITESLRSPAARLTELIDDALTGIDGTIWHGHPVWLNGKTPIAGFKAYSEYITVMLWRGQDLTDAGLTASGSQRMATLKVRSLDDLNEAKLTAWLREALALEQRA